jgi:hypothetical protein
MILSQCASLAENAPAKVVIYANSNKAIVNDRIVYFDKDNKKIKPFISEGDTFLPLRNIANWVGAAVEYDDARLVTTLVSGKKTSYMMRFYNVFISEQGPVLMKQKPIQKDGAMYIPLSSLVQMLDVPYYRDFKHGILVLGSDKGLTSYQIKDMKKRYGLDANLPEKCKELDEIAKKTKLKNIYDLSRNEKIYASDHRGILSKLVLKDDFTLKREKQKEGKYIPDNYYLAGYNNNDDTLYIFKNNKWQEYSETPQLLEQDYYNFATQKTFETRYIKDIIINVPYLTDKLNAFHDYIIYGRHSSIFDQIADEKPLYYMGDKDNSLIEIKKKLNTQNDEKIPETSEYDWYTFEAVCQFQNKNNLAVTGYLDKQTLQKINDIKDLNKASVNEEEFYKERWDRLCDKAKPGDVLLFQMEDDLKYGLNNHAAMVLDVSKKDKKIHLLHARSEYEGVGADKEMDFLSMDMFDSNYYWRSTNRAILYSIPTLTNDQREKLAADAYKKYKNYSFGLGGFIGLKEVMCGELIKDAYSDQNICIYNPMDYLLRIKQSLGRKQFEVIFVPDDLMNFEGLKIQEVWEKVSKK